MNRYGNDNPVYTGKVLIAHYSETDKAIRMEIEFNNGIIKKIEWPITMFKFRPDQDKDKEMRKTADLLVGKKIDVMVDKK
jgi:hypothetical protein